MRALRAVAIAVAVVVVLALVAGFALLRIRPGLEPYADLELGRSAEPGSGLRVTFLGVATLLISDGRTQIMTDGFFTRPGLWTTTFGRVAPDVEEIEAALASVEITRLAAVIPVHSHYDHAMDAPEVARLTGAVLLGSESTANIGRGWGLPEEQIVVAEPGAPYRYGAFTVTLIPSRHVNFGINASTLGGVVSEPLVPPARARDYAEGVSWSVHVAHPRGRLLVQGSAGFVPGALEGREADVVFLGVGGLGFMDDAYRRAYLTEVVEATDAGWLIPIHYDDFTQPLSAPLPLMPRALEDFPGVMEWLRAWVSERPGRALGMLPVLEPVVLPPRPD